MPAEEDESSVFEPLVARTASADRIQVLLTGEAWDRSVAQWPWGDGVLLDVAPLEYPLDLSARAPTPERRTAVVVADPSQDLVRAREEADAVTDELTEAGWSVAHLSGPATTRAALGEALGDADLLHYAGHGESRGDAGWQAALVLAGDARLEVKDILAASSVPSSVVLSGCETGDSFAGTLEGGMNLGRAFVLAGTRAAVVAEGKVPDSLAFEIGTAVYDGVGEADWSLAGALRDAQLRLRAEGRASDWARFRVVVP